MVFEDRTLVCEDCGNEFVFSADEQAFFAEKGFENEPKRCKSCRMKRKQQRRGRNFGGSRFGPRRMYSATCAECGNSTEVPFKPTTGKPVYCQDCYQKRKKDF